MSANSSKMILVQAAPGRLPLMQADIALQQRCGSRMSKQKSGSKKSAQSDQCRTNSPKRMLFTAHGCANIFWSDPTSDVQFISQNVQNNNAANRLHQGVTR
jgi:hypothetical protein